MSDISAKQLRTQIKEHFLAHFSDRGYEPIENRNIVPRDDATVLFCGATISTLKDKIRNRTPIPGRWAIAQRCLRLHDLGNAKATAPRQYLGYFEMVSVLATETSYAEFLGAVLAYVLPVLHGRGLELEIWTRTTDLRWQSDLLDARNRHPFTLTWDRAQKYEWTYGEPGVSGLGCLFHLRKQNAPSREFGQVIQIFRDGSPIGYEFGFGVETFSSLLLGGADAYASSPANEVFRLPDDTIYRALLDHLVAALAILAEDVRPGRGKRESVLRAIVNTIHREFHANIEQIDTFEDKLHQLSTSYFGTRTPSDDLIAILQHKERQQVENEIRIEDYIRNQHNLVRLGLLDQPRASRNIDRYKQKMQSDSDARFHA